MKFIKVTFTVLLIFLTIFFAVTFYLQNMGEVTISYFGLIDAYTVPFSTVLLLALFVGLLVGSMIGILGVGLTTIKLRMQLRSKTKEAKELKKELDSYEGEESFETETYSFQTEEE